MIFEMASLVFGGLPTKTFSENGAPDWLTGEGTRPGSTMDGRWFWKDHVCKLKVGESIDTDFQRIKRIK